MRVSRYLSIRLAVLIVMFAGDFVFASDIITRQFARCNRCDQVLAIDGLPSLDSDFPPRTIFQRAVLKSLRRSDFLLQCEHCGNVKRYDDWTIVGENLHFKEEKGLSSFQKLNEADLVGINQSDIESKVDGKEFSVQSLYSLYCATAVRRKLVERQSRESIARSALHHLERDETPEASVMRYYAFIKLNEYDLAEAEISRLNKGVNPVRDALVLAARRSETIQLRSLIDTTEFLKPGFRFEPPQDSIDARLRQIWVELDDGTGGGSSIPIEDFITSNSFKAPAS